MSSFSSHLNPASSKSAPLDIAQEDWQLDHVGHVVTDLKAAISFYNSCLGFELVEQERIEEQKVEVAFLHAPNTLIELIAPLPGNTNLQKFLEKRGAGLHHVAFRVHSVRKELIRLANLGVQLIDITPREGSRGLEIAFIHPKSTHGMLIELCGEPEESNAH